MAYQPRAPLSIETTDDLLAYLQDELSKIAQELSEVKALELREVHVEPTRQRDGMIVSADGTDWNPGSGEGAYEFWGGTWHKL